MRSSERLWGLMYSYGMGEAFAGAWVEGLTPDEAAARLNIDVAAGVEVDLRTLQSGYAEDSEELVWIGRLTDKWTQILQMRGSRCLYPAPELSDFGGRSLQFSWDDSGIHDISHFLNGAHVVNFSATEPGRREGRNPEALDSYATDLYFHLSDPGWTQDPELPNGWLDYMHQQDSDPAGMAEDLPDEWTEYVFLSANGYSPQRAACISSALTLIGRVTGREVDRAWFDGTHKAFSFE